MNIVTKPEIVPPKVNYEPVSDDIIENRIIHLLKIYPKINPSMMQIGIGSSIPSQMWRPKLQDLIDRKVILEEFVVSPSPTGRHQSYCVLSLWPTEPKSDSE